MCGRSRWRTSMNGVTGKRGFRGANVYGGGYLYRYEGCGLVCKSGGGERFMRNECIVSEARVIFVCELCGCAFRTEGNRKTHRQTRTG